MVITTSDSVNVAVRIVGIEMQCNQRKKTLLKRVFAPVLAFIVGLSCFSISVNAQTDWRRDLGVFRVGVVIGNDATGNAGSVEPFRLALAEALNMNVEIFPARDISSLIEAHRSSRIEYAIYSATAYAATWILCECVEPLVIPLALDQTSSYQAVVISTPSGPVDLGQVTPQNLAIPRSGTLGSIEIALYELEEQGVPIDGAALKVIKSSEQAVREVVEGKFSALLGWSSMKGSVFSGYSRGSLRALIEETGGNGDGYKIIWKSSDIPHPPHAIRKNLPIEAKLILRNTLEKLFAEDPVAYDSIELQYGGGFSVARHGQFSSVIKFARAKMGIRGSSSEITGVVAGASKSVPDTGQ